MKLPRIGARLTMIALLAALASGSVLAERGGRDRHDDRRYEDRHRHDDRYDDRRGDHRGGYRDDYWRERNVRFHDDMRVRVDVYYDSQFRRGRCPPGLARKHNGCMPPGHVVRQWERGRPLPRNVVYAPLPRDLVVQLPPPPLHHEYVRVASDVLLIATGTAMVIDAIEDIGRRR